jgi:tetratricopeptide (TPR) repeat protein
MLFDLRGRGRRRTVQAIYVTLAILMGGGLVLFGIGGATSGGLVDAFTGGGGGGGGDATYEKAVEKAQERIKTAPNDAAAWAGLARAQAQMAGTGDNYDQNTGYTKEAQDDLRAADRAWQKYLALDPAKVDGNVASVMVQIYVQPGGLNNAEKAVAAQEYVIDSQPQSYGLYAQLAQYAYAAGQTRKGDLAAKKAVDLAPEDQKNTLKQSLDEVKTSASGAAATSGATGASG